MNPTPLLDRVARAYPDLPRDEALGKIGKENFSDYLGEDPAGYAAMTVRKVWRMWSAGLGEAMSSTAGRDDPGPDRGCWALGRTGLCSARRRRWWDMVAMATPIAIVTVRRRGLAGGPATQRGADDTRVSARRRSTGEGRRIPILQRLMVLVRAGIFPAQLTALRSAGLLAAAALVVHARTRRHSLRNVDVLILLSAAFGLAIVAGTELTDKMLAAFSFEKGNGGRILGLAVFAIFILFVLILRALSQSARNARQLSAALEGLAWEEFRQAKLPERFRGKVAVVIPAYNEADNIGHVLDRVPAEVCGIPDPRRS